MHKYIMIVLVSLTAGLPVAAEGQPISTKQDSSQNLADVVVAATYEGPSEEEKFPFVLKPDYRDVVRIPERINWQSIQPEVHKTGVTQLMNVDLNLAPADMAKVQMGPVKIFKLNFKNIKRWDFAILSETGTVFRKMSGEGNPPSSIAWDGRGDDGTLLVPGQQYSFSFTPVDKAGNKRTFPGDAFSIPAVCIRDSAGMHIGIANNEIFSPHGFGMLPAASDLAAEVAMLVRYQYTSGLVKVESRHPQRTGFVNRLQSQLHVDDSFLAVQNRSTDCVWVHVK